MSSDTPHPSTPEGQAAMAQKIDETAARFRLQSLASAIKEVRRQGGKWKPQADAIEWAQDEIGRLQKMNEALRAALRCADEEMKAIDDDAVCDHEVGICWCTWIDAREVMRDALAQK